MAAIDSRSMDAAYQNAPGKKEEGTDPRSPAARAFSSSKKLLSLDTWLRSQALLFPAEWSLN